MASDPNVSGYYNIQDIMASQERVSCKFEIEIPNMGYLDSSSHDSDLKMGTKLELPYWLVQAIYNEKFKFANIELPKWYKKFYHEILKADPCVVDLRKMGPYYYYFGILLVNLVDTDNGQAMAKSLLWCFRNRFRKIMDLSSQTDHRDLYKQISKFDNSELEIFKAGQADAFGFIKWQRREFCKLLPSIIISANKNKRKRVTSGEDENTNKQ